jgi:hypothetical protein
VPAPLNFRKARRSGLAGLARSIAAVPLGLAGRFILYNAGDALPVGGFLFILLGARLGFDLRQPCGLGPFALRLLLGFQTLAFHLACLACFGNGEPLRLFGGALRRICGLGGAEVLQLRFLGVGGKLAAVMQVGVGLFQISVPLVLFSSKPGSNRVEPFRLRCSRCR